MMSVLKYIDYTSQMCVCDMKCFRLHYKNIFKCVNMNETMNAVSNIVKLTSQSNVLHQSLPVPPFHAGDQHRVLEIHLHHCFYVVVAF